MSAVMETDIKLKQITDRVRKIKRYKTIYLLSHKMVKKSEVWNIIQGIFVLFGAS